MPTQDAARSGMTLSEGFLAPSMCQELRSVTAQMDKIALDERRKGIICSRKVLTEATKVEIRRLLAEREGEGAGKCLERGGPTKMLPSDDEKDYSYWCCFCNDRNTDLLLCAGCRVSMCIQDKDQLDMGCLMWSHLFRKPNLVFYCPFCARKNSTPFPFTIIRAVVASPESLTFRCDPKLLLITLTLPDENRTLLVTTLIETQVSMWYEGNSDAEGRLVKELGDGWMFTNDIGPILMESLLKGVAKVLDAEPVINNTTWPTLLACHCAEVVLSFGVKAVIPALICGPLPELVLQWAATTTPLVEIIGWVFSPAYVDLWMPVFSGLDFGHFTLLNRSNFVVRGQYIRCSGEGCPTSSLESTSKAMGHGQKKWKIPGAEYYRTPYLVQTKRLEWFKIDHKDKGKGQPTTTTTTTTTSRKRNHVTSPPPPEDSGEGSAMVVSKKRSQTYRWNLTACLGFSFWTGYPPLVAQTLPS
ncbi:hypothetical protein BDM02DRAFT_3132661 [Thelephora ganbajun]|uniref:Uncharacterized protein n=1 Tax=Thelephora ganbajun TaxID=370292 RepID=A0ACB6Z0J9_THEGA|nr:hypothetical protein BDM02DRAFT_3132661 [Thelephora ganbajun]